MGSMSIWHWIIVLIVVGLIFGTKKLRNMGEDLGAAVKGFKDGIRQEEQQHTQVTHTTQSTQALEKPKHTGTGIEQQSNTEHPQPPSAP